MFVVLFTSLFLKKIYLLSTWQDKYCWIKHLYVIFSATHLVGVVSHGRVKESGTVHKWTELNRKEEPTLIKQSF